MDDDCSRADTGTLADLTRADDDSPGSQLDVIPDHWAIVIRTTVAQRHVLPDHHVGADHDSGVDDDADSVTQPEPWADLGCRGDLDTQQPLREKLVGRDDPEIGDAIVNAFPRSHRMRDAVASQNDNTLGVAAVGSDI